MFEENVTRGDRPLPFCYNPKKETKMENQGRIHSFDVLKLLLAFLVVTIHFPFKTSGDYFIAYGKTAVPIFFVISGYLLYRDDMQEMLPRIYKQTIKILLVTIISNIIYGAFFYFLEGKYVFRYVYFTHKKIMDFILYNVSPFSEHLWFLGSMLYALVLIIILAKTNLLKKAMFVAPFLTLAYLLLYWFGPVNPFAYRNALLIALPYLMMGMAIRRFETSLMKIKKSVLWLAALTLCITTIVELKTYRRGIAIPFVSAELLTYVIVLLCLNYKNFGAGTIFEKLGRSCTLFIYIAHIIVAMILFEYIPQSSIFVSTLAPVTVYVVTLVLSLWRLLRFSHR